MCNGTVNIGYDNGWFLFYFIEVDNKINNDANFHIVMVKEIIDVFFI